MRNSSEVVGLKSSCDELMLNAFEGCLTLVLIFPLEYLVLYLLLSNPLIISMDNCTIHKKLFVNISLVFKINI